MSSVVENQTVQHNNGKELKVERIFNGESKISFEEIILSLVDKKIDRLVDDYYHQNKVNIASHEERNVSA
ncbi:hypothetical protein ACQKP0_00600 [Heyndrickxia sp. NPDC080065]|uniref:hypothetical protein n=1 Tax=Heyndrickxia sp. NPDC080065 TaxID=3390568 RepID=UPI003D0862C9